jgi:hypothetical protein
MGKEAAEGSAGQFRAVFGNHRVELATKSIQHSQQHGKFHKNVSHSACAGLNSL